MARPGSIGIHELAKRIGCTVETIHDYERIGVIRPAKSSAGGRVYSANDARQLLFVRRARALGFQPYHIRGLLALARRGTGCAQVRNLAADHLHEIRARIVALRAIERVLAKEVRRCGSVPQASCPFIDALSCEETTLITGPQRDGL